MIGIIPYTYFDGANKPVGSTFLRVNGLVANSEYFEVWRHGSQYDGLIFQKVYWREMMLAYDKPKILDLCDMDWINGTVDIIDIGNLVDAITCSSPELTRLIKGYFPKKIVEHVPDRLDFKTFPEARPIHRGKAKNIVWFGFIPNAYHTLGQLCQAILKHELDLTIIADKRYMQEDPIKELGPKFIKYDPLNAYDHIKHADIVLNPRSDKGRYKYKSNNKSLISWKLGVPVAASSADIDRLLDPNERNKEIAKKSIPVGRDYNILKSVDQYLNILNKIKKNRS